jgi:hypothetical protein
MDFHPVKFDIFLTRRGPFAYIDGKRSVIGFFEPPDDWQPLFNGRKDEKLP